ncbi:hypothetical protein [Prosthecomicrobium hirschii]|uniref:hypothetical protein n=1 Tax=Prosthecodimorpha hirschii TaxID=665126 RepID=UPI0022202B8A|nr:hypothetical protein [Prosthecomicrobium hirschii]MCW1844170.1 hypothetical protein [Prosthecomicrobium hirschii]
MSRAGPVAMPIERAVAAGRALGLSPQKACLLLTIADKGTASREDLMTSWWPPMNRVCMQVHMVEVRRRAADYGVTVETLREVGYAIDGASLQVLADLLEREACPS